MRLAMHSSHHLFGQFAVHAHSRVRVDIQCLLSECRLRLIRCETSARAELAVLLKLN